MNVVIEQNTRYGLVVSSRIVAKELGKRHDHVIRDLSQILENPNVGSLIIPSSYKADGQKRTYKEYLLTKDGFTLYMFNIQGYIDFKMAYINKFNEMEKALAEQKKVPTKVPVSFEHTIASTFGGTPVMETKLLSQMTGLTLYQITKRAKEIGVPMLTKQCLKEYKNENGIKECFPRLLILFKEHVINICKYYGVYDRVKGIIENYFKENNRIAYKQEEERDVLGRTYADRVESTKRMIDMLTKKIDGKLVEIKDICDEIKSYRDHIHSYSTQI